MPRRSTPRSKRCGPADRAAGVSHGLGQSYACGMRCPWPLLIAAVLAACASAPNPEATVEVLRFRQFLVDGALEFNHGGGAWYDCLYLPDAGIVAHVVWETDWKSPTLENHARLYAYRSTLDDARSHPLNSEKSAEAQRSPEPIRIPRAIADRIIELADRTEQLHTTSLQLATECLGDRVVGDESSVGQRDF